MPDPESPCADLLARRVVRAETQRVALVAAIQETRSARRLMVADDEHDPDGSTASLDQARDVALLEQTERTLVELAEAQRRLADGTYGVCDVCGQEIPQARMLARPETRHCVGCAVSGVDRRRRRS